MKKLNIKITASDPMGFQKVYDALDKLPERITDIIEHAEYNELSCYTICKLRTLYGDKRVYPILKNTTAISHKGDIVWIYSGDYIFNIDTEPIRDFQFEYIFVDMEEK